MAVQRDGGLTVMQSHKVDGYRFTATCFACGGQLVESTVTNTYNRNIAALTCADCHAMYALTVELYQLKRPDFRRSQAGDVRGAEASHGTDPGYYAHKRKWNTPICDPCRLAHNKATLERKHT